MNTTRRRLVARLLPPTMEQLAASDLKKVRNASRVLEAMGAGAVTSSGGPSAPVE